jgi:predicted  nucleic acid-binding Zn-ribbon protein
MKDFQQVLRMLMESDETVPDKASPPPTSFSGGVDDATNAAEAFSAFANEHKQMYSQFKGVVGSAEKQLDALQLHSVSFNRSMGSRPDPSTFAAQAPRPKFDRSRVAALQSDLSGMRPQAAPGAVPEHTSILEADGADMMKTSEFIKGAKEALTGALAQYETQLTELIKRTKNKMQEFAGQATGMAANQESLQKKIEELQANFEQASGQVGNLTQRVSSLEQNGRAEDQGEIKKLSSELQNLGAALQQKQAEAEDLAKSLGDVATRASDAMQDMMSKIEELEQYSDELYQQYEKLHSAYSSLHKRAKEQQMISAPEHVRNYGKFDLIEHLSRAKAKDAKKNSADW